MYIELWHELLNKWSDAPESNRSRVLDEVLNGKGIPSEIRPRLWLISTGASHKKQLSPKRYLDCLESPHKIPSVINAIKRDVQRTFSVFKPNFQPGATLRNGSNYLAHEQSLFNVLSALSVAIPDIGYHQGLNFIVAMLLITVKTQDWEQAEEDSFWIASCLLRDYHMAGLYHSYSSFLQQFVDQFDTLFRRFLPRLHSHLSLTLDPKLEPVLFAVDWFTTLFTYSLTLETVQIVWDCFLVARLDEALYVTGLALLLHLVDIENKRNLVRISSSPCWLCNTAFLFH